MSIIYKPPGPYLHIQGEDRNERFKDEMACNKMAADDLKTIHNQMEISLYVTVGSGLKKGRSIFY